MKGRNRYGFYIALLIAALPASHQLLADIIPSSRRTDWTPGTVVGVPGGIPNRTTIGANAVTDYGADPTGVTDSTSAIYNTIHHVSPGQVAYIPAGTYKVSDQIVLYSNQSGITIRGAGPGKTTLALTGGGQFYTNGDWPNPSPTVTITAGATAGSTVLTVDSTSDITVGKLVTITQTNPAYVHYNSTYYGSGPSDCGHDKTRLMALTVKVTGKTSSTVTIEHALPIDMTNSPMITAWTNLISGIGFEDMTFDGTNSASIHPLWFIQVYGCWVKNVEFSHPYQRSVWFQEGVNCEVRHCYTHDNVIAKTEGIDLFQNCCWNLIEDNICVRAGYPMIMLGDWGGGCSCNVVGYNYCLDERSGVGVAGFAISDNHGPHNMFNLYEGNVAQNIVGSDGYYGSSSHGTLFRNCLSGQYDRSTYVGETAITISKWSPFYNVVGNVLGVTGYSSVYEASGNSWQNGVIYKIGYPNASQQSYTDSASNPSDPADFDTNVGATLIRHGNYDYVNDSTTWDSSISNHSIPNSLYLSGKPSWWGTLSWPPIGPDRTPIAGMIPALARFQGVPDSGPSPTPSPTPSSRPSPPSNLHISPP